jgi:hypothetical protein
MKYAFFGMILFVSEFAIADQWQHFVEGICNEDNYVLDYIHGYNEKGVELVNIAKERSADSCVIGKAQYSFKAYYELGHPLGKGPCGSSQYVTVSVIKDGKEMMKDRLFRSCLDRMHISRIIIDKSGDISVTWLEGDPSLRDL